MGWRDAAARAPLPPDAVGRIFSMTKPLVTAAAMALVEPSHHPETRQELGLDPTRD